MPNSGDSPLGTRKRSGSSGEESTLRGVNTNGNAESSADLDLLKQELLHEIRKEMNKMKQEIIEGDFFFFITGHFFFTRVFEQFEIIQFYFYDSIATHYLTVYEKFINHFCHV